MSEPVPPDGCEPDVRSYMPREILEAQEAYLRDLPQLLQEHPGEWVAYYGNRRIGLAKTQDAVFAEGMRQGYKEFLVRRIRPHVDVDFISAL